MDLEMTIADNTPVLVASGQWVERDLSPQSSPVFLAAKAAEIAFAKVGTSFDRQSIDALALVRSFSDSVPFYRSPGGRSNNPPGSVAKRLGIHPEQLIYSEVGGDQPLQLLYEMALKIFSGEISCALIAGAEAIANEKHATRTNLNLDWHEEIDGTFDDRGFGDPILSPAEMMNGLLSPIAFYSMIENRRAHLLQRKVRDHGRVMAEMLAPFSKVARDNPWSQFPQAFDHESLYQESPANYRLTSCYTKRVVSQDAVNQSAAVLLTSVGLAKAKGIPESQWIFIDSFAEGKDDFLSVRPEPGASKVMTDVLDEVFANSETALMDLSCIDLYSCFPCVVDVAATALGLTHPSPLPLTITGGLPFFGGAGNNYVMHALAEMMTRLQKTIDGCGLVTANGGFMSKHCAVILSSHASADSKIYHDRSSPRQPDQGLIEASDPEKGHIITSFVQYKKGSPHVAYMIGENEGQRFVASSNDETVVKAMTDDSLIGEPVIVASKGLKHSFTLGNHQKVTRSSVDIQPVN
ncbi:MAG: hypothetical protein CMP10_20540 [Zetaproteobacteria bacterium]|nr:hypothetical protein [Pseudobdellovibrionaceae bacterium]